MMTFGNPASHMRANSSELRKQALKYLKELEVSSFNKLTFYEYGTFENPGLSDLDLIVEISPDYKYISNFSKNSLPKLIREVMAHASLIALAEGDIYGINLWDDVKLLKVSED